MDTLHLEETVPIDGVEYYWIPKTNLFCEQINISEGPELVAIKIQAYKHPLIVAACYRPQKYSKEQSKTLFEEIGGLIYKKVPSLDWWWPHFTRIWLGKKICN